MNSTVIDRQSTTAVLGVDFDEAFVESNIAPGVVLLRLDGGSDNRIDSNDRDKKQDATGFERFRSRPEERTFLIDCMTQSQCRREDGQSIELQFQIVKVPEIAALEQRFVTRKHDSKLGFDQAVMILVANTHHQSGSAIQGRDYNCTAKHD